MFWQVFSLYFCLLLCPLLIVFIFGANYNSFPLEACEQAHFSPLGSSSTEVVAIEDAEDSICEVAISEEELLGIMVDIIGEATCHREVVVVEVVELAIHTRMALFFLAEVVTQTEEITTEVECPTEGTITRTSEDEEIIVATKINLRATTSGSRVNSGVRSHGVSIITKDIIEYPNKTN